MSAALAAARRDLAVALGGSLVLTVGVIAGVMVVPLYDMHLFDRVLTGRSVHSLIALSLIAAVGLALYAVLVAVRGMLLAAVAERLLARPHEPAVAVGLRRAVGGSGDAAGRALAALLVVRGEATPALLVGANLMRALVLVPLDQLLAPRRSAVAARPAWRRLGALVPGVAAEPDGVVPDGSGIMLRDVVFRADDGHGRAIVDGVSLAVAPGELVVLKGPNGSGKSTALRLAAGVLTSAEGAAAVSGLPADLAAARGLVGSVPRRQQFPRGTVADTIGRFHLTSAEPVVAAARAAGLQEIVGRLPRGYATWTGANDPQFSDGQRQRLALSRALFGDPPALVLDEPDAGLDHEGEQVLVSPLVAARARGAAILVVTHRRPLLSVADRVVRLAGGRLVSEEQREAA